MNTNRLIIRRACRFWRAAAPLTCLLLGWMLNAGTARAQTFDSGSTEADGALDFSGTAPGTIIDFRNDMFATALDPEGDGVYHFTTITIPANVTVRLTARHLLGPVYWLASGRVQIAGILDLSAEPSQTDRIPAIPGAGGFPGGIPGVSFSSNPPYAGSGPGGGQSGGCTDGCGYVGSGRFTGNVFLVPLIGGSGGGSLFGNGGAGGGAILIASSSSIDIGGQILANGGDPLAGSRGGYGSGGAIRLAAPTVAGTGTLAAASVNGGPPGRIRVEAFQQQFTGGTDPAALFRTPFKTYVPTAPPPSVRIVRVGGVPVSQTPTGGFVVPDATISSLATTPIDIETRSIPAGTVVNLTLWSEDGPDVVTSSTALVGSLDQAVASAGAVFPTGFSRVFVRAAWNKP